MLLEPQRANLITHSEYANSVGWGNLIRITALNNQSLSPEGLVNGTKLNETAVNNTHIVDRALSAVSGTTYSLSYFAKAAERTQCYIFAYSDNSVFASQRAIFDLSDGTITSNSGNGAAKIEAYTNGWYRVSLTVTSAATATGYFGFGLALNDAVSYAGVVSNGALFYGIQLEAGYPTSYIPTMGTAQTRAADSCSGGGSAESINSVEGVLYAEAKTFSITGSAGLISLSNGTTSNRVTIELDGANIKVRFVVGGSSIGIFNYAINIKETLKIAAKYKANDFALWVNGTERVAITSGSSFSNNTLSELAFDRGDGNEIFQGNVKQVAVFNEALTDSELATLTTL